MEDEMVLEKRIWTMRAALHTGIPFFPGIQLTPKLTEIIGIITGHTEGLTTAGDNNAHVTEYVEQSERLRDSLGMGAARL
jgi:hypothetical protein